ncbi:MAG: phosphonopyruvate decarboxylase [Cyclobacteriaceae bacterium]
MLNLKSFENIIASGGVEFISGVPDTLLNELCLHIQTNWPKERHVIAANEGNAVALAAGYHLATNTIPLVYLQNSGMGNTLNPLLSLTNKEVSSVPLILIIGWRGDPAVNDWPQHKKQGEVTPKILDLLDIPYKVLDQDDTKSLESTKWALETAKSTRSPVALIAKKGVFEKGEKEDLSKQPSQYELSREKAIVALIDKLPSDTLYVATTGRATRELHAIREYKEQSHQFDFLNVGAMGHASSIAAGINIAQRNRLVVCLDGDAGALMHLGSIPVNGRADLRNYIHVVLNNGVHESVGGQESVGHRFDYCKLAEGAGYTTPGRPISTKKELTEFLDKQKDNNGPVLIDLHIRKGMRQDMPPLRVDTNELKELFTNSLLKADVEE